MAIAETQVYIPQAPRPRLRLLEDERWLAIVLLVPTLVLLGMFIAYPFVRGTGGGPANALISRVVSRTLCKLSAILRIVSEMIRLFHSFLLWGDIGGREPFTTEWLMTLSSH